MAMKQILVVYYSQSGEAARVADAVAQELASDQVDLSIEVLEPEVTYPYPWKSPARFFSVLPECHWGPLPPLAPLKCDGHRKFDLVILVYQVWFLAPSLPVQSFLRSGGARVMRDTKVVTFSISRNMWQSASETMKGMLKDAGARHVDNVVLTHQGPAWATFITTPRALLFGKKETFAGVFPAVGISSNDLDRVRVFGRAIQSQIGRSNELDDQPFLRGLGAVKVDRQYLLAERLGFHVFRWWGRVILALGGIGRVYRTVAIYMFVGFLVSAILVGIPLTMLVRLLLHPFIHRRLASYTRRLQQPSDCCARDSADEQVAI